MYDPQSGRFVQRDPLFGLIGSPQSLNRYSYVRNNPATLVDPSGFMGQDDDAKACIDPSSRHFCFGPFPIVGPNGALLIGASPVKNFDPFGGDGEGDIAPSTHQLGNGSSPTLTIESILRDPQQLAGRSPEEVETALGSLPSTWRVERLGQGSQQGQGWMLREYSENGQITGRNIRWHPGGGHHGPDPYWRVGSPEFGTSPEIPAVSSTVY